MLIVAGLGLLGVVLLYQNLPECREVPKPSTTYVTPEELKAYQNTLTEPIRIVEERNITLSPAECPPAPLCPELPTTTTATTTTLICPPATIPPETAKAALNIRLPDAAPCEQSGCIKCLRKEWEILDLPGRPKFNPGPSPGNAQDFYSVLKGNNATSDDYCFQKRTGSEYGLAGEYHGRGFFLNESLWDWTHTNNTWLVDNITTKTDHDGDNYTVNNPYVEQNESGSLWIQKR